MLNTNPFSILAEIIAPIAMQGFIIAMIILIALGTIIQIINHKNLTYIFNNQKSKVVSNQRIRNWRKNINYCKNSRG